MGVSFISRLAFGHDHTAYQDGELYFAFRNCIALELRCIFEGDVFQFGVFIGGLGFVDIFSLSVLFF